MSGRVGRAQESITPEVAADFAASKAYGVAHLEEIAEGAADDLNLPADELLTYLRENIDYTLSRENLAGLELYYCLAAKLGLIPKAKATEWASLGREIRNDKLRAAQG